MSKGHATHILSRVISFWINTIGPKSAQFRSDMCFVLNGALYWETLERFEHFEKVLDCTKTWKLSLKE